VGEAEIDGRCGAEGMERSEEQREVIRTPIGELLLVADADGLSGVHFRIDQRPKRGKARLPVLQKAIRQIEEYFEGKRTTFDVPLSLRGTPFQLECWLALQKIPYGATATYGEIARSIGRPAAVRAVGAANGANPIPIIVPCHRVIGSNGSLTGFGGGIDVKRWLLDFEQNLRLRV
jgi:methylated-DNA-[protein]-cysteine S-methyltransferase